MGCEEGEEVDWLIELVVELAELVELVVELWEEIEIEVLVLEFPTLLFASSF